MNIKWKYRTNNPRRIESFAPQVNRKMIKPCDSRSFFDYESPSYQWNILKWDSNKHFLHFFCCQCDRANYFVCIRIEISKMTWQLCLSWNRLFGLLGFYLQWIKSCVLSFIFNPVNLYSIRDVSVCCCVFVYRIWMCGFKVLTIWLKCKFVI